jgi:hypothetical protein
MISKSLLAKPEFEVLFDKADGNAMNENGYLNNDGQTVFLS